MTKIKRVFTVDGKPFFSVGAQARNSSGYNDAESETAFKAVKLLHGNTLSVPVYWDQVEPQEGKFDFSPVDALLASAARYEVKLVLLWFGTWKNGYMEYAPAWVKTNPARFKRVISPGGKDVWVLSSHCQATLEADQRAFTALCAHLKARDTEHTVIALQIENEPGILGSDRDYGPEAQATFEVHVPAELVAKMKAAGAGRVYDLWQAAGARAAGSWPELFGWAGGELMTAWSIATYIDHLAAAGKAILDMPMYINVWLGEGGWRIAGESYPSGGAVGKTLDIYKWSTPHIDLIAPDDYVADSRGYEAMLAIYARDDNPLFVPESAPGGSNAWLMFRAIADYGAIGYHFFAAEQIVAEDGTARPDYKLLIDSFRAVAAVAPLLLQYQGTGKVHAICQEENLGAQTLDLEGYTGIAHFDASLSGFLYKDWRHQKTHMAIMESTEGRRGRGLVFQVSRNEFYLVGSNYRLVLRPKLAPEMELDASLAKDFLLTMQARYLAVDEGHFDAQGHFVIDRHRNGDESASGLWMEADCGVLHVTFCD